MTLVQWSTKITALFAQEEVAADASATADLARGDLNAKMDVLHSRTQQGLSLLKTNWRNDPAKSRALQRLSAIGDSRTQVLEEALAFESAWETIDPAWVPLAGQTLALFKVLRGEAATCLETYAAGKAGWRQETENFNQLVEILDRDCIGWYSAATLVFPEGTAEGDMIRGTVPTTTDFTPLPTQAEITLDAPPGANSILFSIFANHATKYDVYRQGPGETEFTKTGSDVDEGAYLETGLAVGSYLYKVVGKNSRGSGPESEVLGAAVV